MENRPGGSLARIGVPVARHMALEEDLTANQLKLFVGLQYLASQEPDIDDKDDPNCNISTLPEFKDDKLPPLWKKINVTNWKETLERMGFKTDNPARLKRDLLKTLTRVQVPPYPVWVDGEKCTVETRGSSIIRVKTITGDKSQRIREFSILVGGYDLILNKYWQSISSKFLFYEGNIGIPTWRFIIQLGGTIRHEYKHIKDYQKKYKSLPKYWIFLMNMSRLEERMRIASQSNERKGEAWKEIYIILGTQGTSLADTTDFPIDKMKAYGLKEFFKEQHALWLNAKGIPENPVTKDMWREHKAREMAVKEQRRKNKDSIIFVLTKQMLLEWMPLRGENTVDSKGISESQVD